MAHGALALKDEGNRHFQSGDYASAEKCYTKAIQRDPSNPKLFTNRALTRQKLLLTSPSLDDCLHAISLDPSNMKAFYYLSQAQLALHRPNEAHASALTAYNFCVETGDRSIQNVSGLVLQTKKAVWEGKERQRIRERDSLLRECLEGLERNMREEMGVLGLDGLDFEYDEEDAQRSRDRRRERSDIQDSHKRKVDELQSVFAIANPKDLPRPAPPDYLIDNVSFAIMHDPVTTKTGISYDRSTMIEHLKRSEKDPLTGEPLSYEDLRPNRALKEACERFLEENGWAVDW